MTDSYAALYIVRHGESLANVTNIWGGDEPLSQKGKEQVENLAQSLKDISFSAIYSSDLQRAIQTVAQIAEQQNIPIKTLPTLRERHYGEIEGRMHQDFMDEYKDNQDVLERLNSPEDWSSTVAIGCETNQAALERFTQELLTIAQLHLGQNVLIASHGNIMRCLLIDLGFSSFPQLPGGSIQNTGWFRVESDGVTFILKETHGVIKKAS